MRPRVPRLPTFREAERIGERMLLRAGEQVERQLDARAGELDESLRRYLRWRAGRLDRAVAENYRQLEALGDLRSLLRPRALMPPARGWRGPVAGWTGSVWSSSTAHRAAKVSWPAIPPYPSCCRTARPASWWCSTMPAVRRSRRSAIAGSGSFPSWSGYGASTKRAVTSSPGGGASASSGGASGFEARPLDPVVALGDVPAPCAVGS